MQWHLPKRHLTGQKIYEKPVMWNKRNQRLDLKLTRFLFVERTDHIFWSAILIPGAKSIYSSGIIKALCSTKENKCLDTPTSERNLFLLHTHLQEQNCYKIKAQQNKRKLKDSFAFQGRWDLVERVGRMRIEGTVWSLAWASGFAKGKLLELLALPE